MKVPNTMLLCLTRVYYDVYANYCVALRISNITKHVFLRYIVALKYIHSGVRLTRGEGEL